MKRLETTTEILGRIKDKETISEKRVANMTVMVNLQITLWTSV